jgi:hypothetical protein
MDADVNWSFLTLVALVGIVLFLFFASKHTPADRTSVEEVYGRGPSITPIHIASGQKRSDTRLTRWNKPTVHNPVFTFYLRKHLAIRCKAAIAALEKGQADPGHIRDLIDAALLGNAVAAATVGAVIRSSKFANGEKRFEAHSWQLFAEQLNASQAILGSFDAVDFYAKLSDDEKAKAQAFVSVLNTRRLEALRRLENENV